MGSIDTNAFGPPLNRRALLAGGSGLIAAAWAWPRFGRADEPSTRVSLSPPPARSCILVYLLGGPPQLDTFDLKPLAPTEVRGPFRPIVTSVPGVEICEHLPRLATTAERFSLVRSVSYPNSNHTPMIYYTLTGFATEQPLLDNDIRPPQSSDFPHLGSVVWKYGNAPDPLPGFVAIPGLGIRSSTEGEFKRARLPLRGGGPGFLGGRYAPLAVDGEPGSPAAVPALEPPAEVTARRFEQRRQLLEILERRRPLGEGPAIFDLLRQQAVALTGGGPGAGPFSLEGEPPALRERYGSHRFGRALLLARRLTEAGVPLVAVHFNEMTRCDGWDTHSGNFAALESELLPMLDQGLSALLEDLDQRGRLGETLVVCQGEFGRTPKINANAGRDHWGDCSTTLLAGGGIRGGQVYGQSDRQAAFPLSHRVDPADIQATIYQRLGIDPRGTMRDHLGRPFPLSHGRPLTALM